MSEPVEKGRWLRDTETRCPKCRSILSGSICETEGMILLRARCPSHGPFEIIISRHADWYRSLTKILPKRRPKPRLLHRPEEVSARARGVFLDLTDRCNLHCPNCLSNVSRDGTREEPSLEEVLDGLRRLLPWKPVLYLGGGEPTTRADLPLWIRTLREQGYTVKLLTNGLRLVSREYCETLYSAGVRWICLQYDSPNEWQLRRIRGQTGLENIRKKVLENLSEAGFDIDLACMIDQETNMRELGNLIRLGFATKGVRHVSFMPSRRIGRGEITSDQNRLEEYDLIRALDDQTQGIVTPADWLLFQRILGAAYRISSDPDLAPRRCFLTLPLLGTEENFAPITKWWRWIRNRRDCRALSHFLLGRGQIEEFPWSDRILIISIESFWELEHLDLQDAALCNRYYWVDGTFRQACIYNLLNRPLRQEGRTRQGGSRPSDPGTVRHH